MRREIIEFWRVVEMFSPPAIPAARASQVHEAEEPLPWSAHHPLQGEEILPVAGIRIRSEIVARRTADAVEHDFLNSFIADDLARVAAAVDRDGIGQALRDYLRPTAELDTGARLDVRTRLNEVRQATDPERVPLGRWPASPDRPLALGQQLAVDEGRAARRRLAAGGRPGGLGPDRRAARQPREPACLRQRRLVDGKHLARRQPPSTAHP